MSPNHWTASLLITITILLFILSLWIQNFYPGDFPGGPLVKELPSSAGEMGSISDQGTNISHVMELPSLRTLESMPQERVHVLQLRPDAVKNKTNKHFKISIQEGLKDFWIKLVGVVTCPLEKIGNSQYQSIVHIKAGEQGWLVTGMGEVSLSHPLVTPLSLPRAGNWCFCSLGIPVFLPRRFFPRLFIRQTTLTPPASRKLPFPKRQLSNLI